MSFFQRHIDVRDMIKEVPDAQIYMFIGERHDGKTFSSLSYGLDRFVETELPFVYVRRLDIMLSASNNKYLFNGNAREGDLGKHLNQLGYDGVTYYSKTFWPTVTDEHGKSNRLDSPVCICRSISTWETTKGASLPFNGLLIFDEFLTREGYLPGEVIMFENLMSSVIRGVDEAKVVMLGNPVNMDCPYFVEWGLRGVRNMKQGTYDVYSARLEDGRERKIVVCYLAYTGAKAADVYISGNNAHSKSILTGEWELGVYPRFPYHSDKWARGVRCFIQSYNGWVLSLQTVLSPDGNELLFVYPYKEKPLEEDNRLIRKRYRDTLVYTDFVSPCVNVRFCLTNWRDDLTKYILSAYHQGRIYYADAYAGENLRNYMQFCEQYNPIGV